MQDFVTVEKTGNRRRHANTVDATLRLLAQARAELEPMQPHMQLAPAIQALRRVERYLARPLRYAIMGEANSGKSSLANLLLGIESLPTGVVANTRFPTLLRHSVVPTVNGRLTDGRLQPLTSDFAAGLPDNLAGLEVGMPSDFLRTCELLDLAGLSSNLRWPQTQLQMVDGILWCTAATQAWRASEAQAFATLSTRLRRSSLLAITFCDLLGADEAAKVRTRLTSQVGQMFGAIETVATRDGIDCLRSGDAGARENRWSASGALPLIKAIQNMGETILSDRAATARAITGRIAERTLQRIERPVRR
jgi:hypothetical protein